MCGGKKQDKNNQTNDPPPPNMPLPELPALSYMQQEYVQADSTGKQTKGKGASKLPDGSKTPGGSKTGSKNGGSLNLGSEKGGAVPTDPLANKKTFSGGGDSCTPSFGLTTGQQNQSVSKILSKSIARESQNTKSKR